MKIPVLLVSLIISSQVVAATPKLVKVLLETNKGNIELELDSVKAKKTTENFVKYVNSGFYNGTVFHRVINGFMIQGGGFTKDMVKKKTNGPIKNEADNGLKNNKYTIAMARTGDPHSATAQFFINVVDNANLNHSAKTQRGWGYAVFGKVTKGENVVNIIKRTKTNYKKGMQNFPVEDIIIKSAKVLAANTKPVVKVEKKVSEEKTKKKITK